MVSDSPQHEIIARFEEFESLTGTTLYVSATPADYEIIRSEGAVVEQIIRPTALIDPPLEVRSSENQIDDLIEQISERTERDEKIIVTTLTKRSAEELATYFERMGIRCRYIHSDVDTLERVQILEDLRAGIFDVLIGVNLLREGLDLPEVSLVVIIDADMEGMLRNVRAITQIAGRAARHENGLVIMYANKVTKTMRTSIEESNRRRYKQIRYNMEHQLMPRQAHKSSGNQPILQSSQLPAETQTTQAVQSATDIKALIDQARADMERAAKSLDFLAAARYRDRIQELEKLQESKS